MSDLQRLHANREAAFKAIKDVLAKLNPLARELRATGAVPWGWVEQNAALIAARSQFEQADREYVDALHQRS